MTDAEIIERCRKYIAQHKLLGHRVWEEGVVCKTCEPEPPPFTDRPYVIPHAWAQVWMNFLMEPSLLDG